MSRPTESNQHQRCRNTKGQRITFLLRVDATFLSCRWTQTKNTSDSTDQGGVDCKILFYS